MRAESTTNGETLVKDITCGDGAFTSVCVCFRLEPFWRSTHIPLCLPDSKRISRKNCFRWSARLDEPNLLLPKFKAHGGGKVGCSTIFFHTKESTMTIRTKVVALMGIRLGIRRDMSHDHVPLQIEMQFLKLTKRTDLGPAHCFLPGKHSRHELDLELLQGQAGGGALSRLRVQIHQHRFPC